MSPEELDAISKVCEAATPGPWAVHKAETWDGRCIVRPLGILVDETNAIFIGAAREWVPALVQHVRELEADRNELSREFRQASAQAAGMGSVALQLVREEREACAKIAEGFRETTGGPGYGDAIRAVARLIRARGNK